MFTCAKKLRIGSLVAKTLDLTRTMSTSWQLDLSPPSLPQFTGDPADFNPNLFKKEIQLLAARIDASRTTEFLKSSLLRPLVFC